LAKNSASAAVIWALTAAYSLNILLTSSALLPASMALAITWRPLEMISRNGADFSMVAE
jgi:hypothetical protein